MCPADTEDDWGLSKSSTMFQGKQVSDISPFLKEG